MNWKELELYLKDKHLYFHRIVEARKGGDVVVGLSQYCAPIIKQMRMDKINEVLPDEYVVGYLPNIQTITITRLND